jgi:glucose-1-phosphate thymidylyltransferase
VNDRTKSNEDRLGSLGDIKYVVENMKVIDDVIIIAGDNLFEFSLDPIYSLYAKKRKAAIALYDVQDMELAKHYGIVGIDSNNKIISFEEKPSKPKSTLSSTGVYIYPYSTIKQLIHFVENHGKMDKAGDFLEWLYKQDDVYCFVSNEKWYDIGTLDQLNKADKEFMK